MSIREVQQLASLIISIVIALTAHVCLYRTEKQCFYGWAFVLYGWVGIIFYCISLLPLELGHVLSPTRSLVQYTIIATQLLAWTLQNKRRL